MNFVWPSELNAYEHREVFNYIIDPIWEPDGKELAINMIEYRRLLESGILDEPKGTRIVDPIWEPDGKELVIECHHLLGSETFDESKERERTFYLFMRK